MSSLLQSKRFFRAGIVVAIVLVFSTQMGFTKAAAADTFMAMVFDQSIATIGRTPRLIITISNLGVNTIRVTRLQCSQEGTSVSGGSFTQIPTTVESFQAASVYKPYRAASFGLTTVHCNLSAFDTVTGEQFTVSANASINVLSETRLYFDATSATRVATVGQTVFIQAKYGNRGKTPFINTELSCVELGRSLVFISSTPVKTTILPGQSYFVEYKLRAERPGVGPISCSFSAVDSTDGSRITLPNPLINIEVR